MLFPSRLCCYPTPCSGPINSATCSCFLPPVLSFTSWHQLHRGQLSLPHLFSLLSPRLGVLPQAHSPDIYKAPARCPRWRPALSFLELCSHSPNKGDLIKKKATLLLPGGLWLPAARSQPGGVIGWMDGQAPPALFQEERTWIV